MGDAESPHGFDSRHVPGTAEACKEALEIGGPGTSATAVIAKALTMACRGTRQTEEAEPTALRAEPAPREDHLAAREPRTGVRGRELSEARKAGPAWLPRTEMALAARPRCVIHCSRPAVRAPSPNTRSTVLAVEEVVLAESAGPSRSRSAAISLQAASDELARVVLRRARAAQWGPRLRRPRRPAPHSTNEMRPSPSSMRSAVDSRTFGVAGPGRDHPRPSASVLHLGVGGSAAARACRPGQRAQREHRYPGCTPRAESRRCRSEWNQVHAGPPLERTVAAPAPSRLIVVFFFGASSSRRSRTSRSGVLAPATTRGTATSRPQSRLAAPRLAAQVVLDEVATAVAGTGAQTGCGGMDARCSMGLRADVIGRCAPFSSGVAVPACLRRRARRGRPRKRLHSGFPRGPGRRLEVVRYPVAVVHETVSSASSRFLAGAIRASLAASTLPTLHSNGGPVGGNDERNNAWRSDW
jgi:hypothetical protein